MTHPTSHQLDQWLFSQEQLNSSDTLFIRLHLEQCPNCRKYVDSLRTFEARLVSHISGAPTERDIQEANRIVEPERVEHPFTIIYKIAAIFALVALAGVIYYFVQREGPSPKSTVQVQPAGASERSILQSETAKKAIADNFIPSPHLEDLVMTEYRSSSIDIGAPKNGDTVMQPVVFQWKETGNLLTLKIFSNHEKTILARQSLTNSFTLKKRLTPGLYYWKLESDEELLYTGKFVVQK